MIFISTCVASINDFMPLSFSAYGQSKAALNYTVKELSFEHEKDAFTCIALHPGVVASEMGQTAVVDFERNSFPEVAKMVRGMSISVETSVADQIKVIDSLTKSDNGRFYSYDGSKLQW